MSTRIGWAQDVWNPTVGCSQVSDECQSCYAIGVAHRGLASAHRGLTVRTEGGIDWTGEVRCLPERLNIPLKVRKPTRWFVDSMSDLFHPAVPSDFIAEVFAVMALGDQHQFLTLTKRPARMAKLLANDAFVDEVDSARLRRNPHLLVPDWPLPNVWAGVSIGRDEFCWRADHLRRTPAAVRWLSLEPLLSDLPSLDLTDIDWVVAGGESGPRHRDMHPHWLANIAVDCHQAGVPLFVKQDSHARSGQQGRIPDELWARKEYPEVAR